MQTRYDAVINNVLLSSLDERIIVTDIQESKPDTRVSASEKPANAGSFWMRANRVSLSVTVKFVLWERDPAQRRMLLDKVIGWATGDLLWLGVSQRPGCYLIVRMDDPPVIPSAMKWLDEISIVFTAYEFPFWREIEYSQTTVAYGENGVLYAPGNGKTFVSAQVTNTGTEEIAAVYLYVGATQMGFYGISLPAGQTLVISYDERNLLSAKIGDISVLDKRTTDSSDDMIMTSGQYTGVLAVANVAEISVVFKAQGVYS